VLSGQRLYKHHYVITVSVSVKIYKDNNLLEEKNCVW
jgi:hypothetical protein